MFEFNYFTRLISELDEDSIEKYLNDFINNKPSYNEIIEVLNACREAMVIVGRKFDKREYSIGDVIYAGELQRSIMETLEPIISKARSSTPKIVLDDIYVDSMNVGEKVFRNVLSTSGYNIA